MNDKYKNELNRRKEFINIYCVYVICIQKKKYRKVESDLILKV